MSTLTIRLPEDTVQRFRILARMPGLSVNKLIEEMSTHGKKALAIIDRLNGRT
ncbi:ribbon-helix-helix protein, CopG family [Pollutimonas bauzanensis]|uniref:Ribbon-helix-helix protein, copG family n=1 Tax=Pollutimonas bauzanensis TaxID=658167 RepID=A0A1M5Z7E0_9BURK|nr:ribbon-helix-helix protein, CopG family [Pollutimonas bauzanensis]SHI19803.1 Ribbon-helix-helix protein, copG family [Pollutimonas bauzanensis]